MRFPKRLNDCLNSQIDFGSFHVLAVIRRKRYETVVLIVPKKATKPGYYGILVGQNGSWYPSVDAMLENAVFRKLIGNVRKAVLLYRFKRMARRYGL